jgi:peptidoglycan/xylan/chitin deacetylase (PgdA/CDA1 family)
VLTFNLSIDFELGWGALSRLAADDRFHDRVAAGLEHTPAVIGALTRYAIPSTWGVVAACSAESVEELAAQAPDAFRVVEPQLATLASRRRDYRRVLFCPQAVTTISRAAGVELASHGLLHLLPGGIAVPVLRSDVAASVARLRTTGAAVESFIPPQNYHWPDEALTGMGIRYVRHTPKVFGFAYSDPRPPAKIARLWNDLIRPVSYRGGREHNVRLLFLRIDRGAGAWERQLRLIRQLLGAGAGSLYCFSHPHNLDSTTLVRRFTQLCEAVRDAAAAGSLTFGKFFRQLPSG